MTRFRYPRVDDIITLNILTLGLYPVKRRDRHEVLSEARIRDVLEQVKSARGGVYDKAAVLLAGLVRAHAFASGNRRTAFVAAKRFVLDHNAKVKISDDPLNARVLLGIREGYYSHDEIREWIENGSIRKFERTEQGAQREDR